MKKSLLIIPVCWFMACINTISPNVTPDKHEFFPVLSFIRAQVKEVELYKLPIQKYSRINNKRDSVLLSQDEFDSLAKEFMEPDINDPSIKKFYTETSFADQSIPTVTFMYSTGNSALTIQRMDIIVNPDPVLDDQVRSVYLEKVTYTGDTAVVKKLYWKANKYFQIISSVRAGVGPSAFREVKVAWSATD